MLIYTALIEDPQNIPLFERLYETYRASMFRIAFAILRDHHLAEDAVAEAFIKIAGHMDKLSSVSGQARKDYIVILTRNCALDLYRKRKRQESIIDFVEELPDPAGGETPEEILFRQEDADRLHRAVADLSPIYRDVMKLYYLYEHTAAETAAILGIQENTVFARLSRGRKKLAEALTGKEEVTP